MYIRELYENKDSVLSFEVFPPKQASSLETITNSLVEMASLNPGFISVTYGAGGYWKQFYDHEYCFLYQEYLRSNPHGPSYGRGSKIF